MDKTKLDERDPKKVLMKRNISNNLKRLQATSKTQILERIETQMTNQLAPNLNTRRRIDMRVVREKQLEVR